MSGGTGSDTLFGGAGDDVLSNSSGNDTLVGGSGNDTLTATLGNDHLYGGDGNDSLDGGADDDQLYGGNGRDSYLFSGDFGNDTIYEAEFNPMDDTLIFNDISDFTELSIIDVGGDIVITAGSNSVTIIDQYEVLQQNNALAL